MHAIRWFEIAAADLERAFHFYQDVFPGRVRMGTFGGSGLVLFDADFQQGAEVGGSIVFRPDFVPSPSGPLLYLSATEPIHRVTERIKQAGGELIVPLLDLGKFGFAAIFIDSEGNRLGILSHEA